MNKLELNNKVILLRKSLKSILNQTKLNFSKKIKKVKVKDTPNHSLLRKESELEALKRLKLSDIPLAQGTHPEKLQKLLTTANSSEIERAVARVLLNPTLQKTITGLKESYGSEAVETFLRDNEDNIKKNLKGKLNKQKNEKNSKKKDKVKKIVKKSESESDEDIAEEDQESKSEAESLEESEKPLKLPQQKSKKVPAPPTKPAKTKNNSDPPVPKKKVKTEVFEKSLDSFFVDSSGQNYLAAVTGAATDSEEEEERKPFTRPVRKNPVQTSKRLTRPEPKRFNENPPIRRKPEPKPETKPSITEEADIHPSWKAKAQLRKVQIQDFKGVKTKFDD